MYIADSDPERGENVCVLMPINHLENIRNIVKKTVNIVKKCLKLRKSFYTTCRLCFI